MFRSVALLALLFACSAVAAEPEKPRLVVLVVFDQMRGDYLERWKALFGDGGFARLQSEGAWYANCHYPYAITATGPGHASLLTGCGPNTHGIVGNSWYERSSGAVVNCSQHTRYQRVPPLPKNLPPDELLDEFKPREIVQEKQADTTVTPAKAYGTPERLLAPTFGDALKAATDGKGKAFGFSFKDRSALLPLGAKADGAYWLDSTDGTIITSTYYRDAVHPWVAEINRKRAIDRWFGKNWERLRDDLDYEKFSGPDDVVGESKGSRQGVTFPHRMDGGLKRPGKAYYDALATSPFGNELILELAKAAVVAEKLGQDDVPDLLSISFSCNDPVGHAWGPDSQEVLDTMLRSDRQMADLLAFLDQNVGEGKYILCMTADHGICPLPEIATQRGLDAQRVSVRNMLTNAETFLRRTFDPLGDGKARFIENRSGYWIYLNTKLIASKGLELSDVTTTLVRHLQKQEGILRVFTPADLKGELDPYDSIGHRLRMSYYPDRCGDIGCLLKPYWLEGDPKTGTGTSHGTPYSYDTHVPLLVFGPNVQPGIRREEVTPNAIAAIFAKSVGIAPPAKAEYPSPAGLFKK
jgi:predicted AlkP superfamily pyrophosphatase or phosphodiesterase